MFKKDAFCNVASNNRTNKQSAVFIYKTTDDITTVTATDYFLDKIVDLQLHDIIVHEKINAADQTNVTWNLLSVTSRTLTSVTATLLETGLENRVSALEIAQTALTTRVTTVEGKVTTIEGKIPTQASAENQLADKNFVNSSIATETAHYISDNGNPFTSVAALEAYTGTVTNNDYAFVTGTDSEGNIYYDRYKATVSGSTVTWAKEYRLNNSSFTSNQWTAINSGITAALVTKITELENILPTLYPVGSLYIGTQSTCPMSTLISGSTWLLVSSGKALWTGDGTNANTTIDAGLPNITGGVGDIPAQTTSVGISYGSGAFSETKTANYFGCNSGGSSQPIVDITFDASNSNSIYGNSTTVQPPAYVVNVWRRTA